MPDVEATKTVLNDYLIDTVTQTWKVIQKDPIKHGLVFYSRMFTEHPEVKPLFSFSSTLDEIDINKNELVKEQARKLTNMISFAVRSLRNLDNLVAKLRKSGADHYVKYHIKAEQFQVVRDSLLWTLKQGLGVIYTDDVHKQWTTFYDYMAGVMIEGGQEAMAANGN